MGGRAGTCEADPHDGLYDVHVRQWASDILDYDGCDGIQEPLDGTTGDKLGVPTIRERRNSAEADVSEGGLCGNANCVVWPGNLESKSDGVVTVRIILYGDNKQDRGLHELTWLLGRRDQIGWHGRARGNHWNTPYQRFNRCIILCQTSIACSFEVIQRFSTALSAKIMHRTLSEASSI
jgi:hypothetical protein